MFSWLLGGIIVALTIYVVIRSVVKTFKGGGCCCDNCGHGECCSSLKEIK